MSDINISSAQYVANLTNVNENVCIQATIDGQELSVPLAPGNRHYDEIMRQVEAGDLTIEDAD